VAERSAQRTGIDHSLTSLQPGSLAPARWTQNLHADSAEAVAQNVGSARSGKLASMKEGDGSGMIHHIGVFASDFDRSREFYRAALRPLGIVIGYETEDIAEFWHEENDTPSLSLERAQGRPTSGVHIAFAARDRSAVEEFFKAAVAAGGSSRHPPRHWPEYSAYCAFVSDPDSNNVEALHKD